MPTTTAIVVNYNGGGGLARCVAAVRAQEPALDEVVVVDNASTDGSADALGDDVRVVHQPHNAGFGAAVAAGLAASSGEIVWILNPDAFMEPGCHATALAAFEGDPQVGAVSPRVLQAAHPTLIDATAIGLTSAFGQLNVDYGLRDEDVPRDPRRVLGPLGGASLWRRAALDRAGGFSDWYFLYWEDIDASLRLVRTGFTCVTAPTARVLHEGGASVGRMSTRNVFQMTRNHWPCLFAALPVSMLLRHPLRVALAPVRAALLYTRRGKAVPAFTGLLIGLLLIPSALLRRGELPPGDARQALAALMADADADRQRMKKAGS